MTINWNFSIPTSQGTYKFIKSRNQWELTNERINGNEVDPEIFEEYNSQQENEDTM